MRACLSYVMHTDRPFRARSLSSPPSCMASASTRISFISRMLPPSSSIPFSLHPFPILLHPFLHHFLPPLSSSSPSLLPPPPPPSTGSDLEEAARRLRAGDVDNRAAERRQRQDAGRTGGAAARQGGRRQENHPTHSREPQISTGDQRFESAGQLKRVKKTTHPPNSLVRTSDIDRRLGI